jgi:osmotically-inducible protein OsmY
MDPRKYKAFRWSLIVFMLAAFIPAGAQNAPASPQSAGDNTRMNQGDQSPSAMTADQQKNDRSDLELTRDVRRSLMQDKSLSTYAHNVKVIAQNGKVTLKGPVRSDDEKAAVIAKAAEVAGQANINDQITVVPKTTK